MLQRLWQRQYSEVWAALQGFAWGAPLQPVMAALADRLRAELMDMLGSAYSSVKPAKVAALCGLSEQDARRGACLGAVCGLLDSPPPRGRGSPQPLARTSCARTRR